jgi:uncharacterized protein YdgA (DUF945 family)
MKSKLIIPIIAISLAALGGFLYWHHTAEQKEAQQLQQAVQQFKQTAPEQDTITLPK